ncbi:uncharacterized protein LOC132941304 isoform X2 [Metopolophium dirhodum]|uniref:uncharacterized protein LOC132941304 isoform X2 n=1 Tax=Metopolophium dirhodum TaxID=44670 RepID=UPI002990726C|nr:uncharacterized protein LOC132941304 isoform X2 [Metopolophium dirhodum]
MKSAKRILLLSSATIFQCLKLTFAFQLNIPKPDTVYLSVPANQYNSIQWLENPNYMKSTCGTFTAYKTKTVVGRWYTIYVSNIPSTTDYCSQFTNVRNPCRCSGIDFTIAIEDSVISFVMFSTNTAKNSVTYELATASFFGNQHLNMNQIILRSFVLRSNAKMTGLGGFIIPHGVIVDSDDFKSYIIMVFCKERAVTPIVMILVNALPISEKITNTTLKYLNDNQFNSQLFKVHHHHCKHGQNIVGYNHD